MYVCKFCKSAVLFYHIATFSSYKIIASDFMVFTPYYLQLHVTILAMHLFDSVICTILFRKRHRQTLSMSTINLSLEMVVDTGRFQLINSSLFELIFNILFYMFFSYCIALQK